MDGLNGYATKKSILINQQDKRYYGKYLAVYTIMSVVTGLIVFFWFYMNDKSFIWKIDGLPQHFNALVYYRSWLRELFHNIFAEHRLEAPLWNLNIGYGSDIVTTLHYYVIGEPLNLFSALVPKESYMEKFYCGLIVLRIYLAGLSFSAYSFYHKNKAFPTLMGAMIYIFGDWTLMAIRHPFFITPLIFLPLVLLGIDKIYKREKSWVYIVSLALAVLSNFYFAYMISIFIVVYAVFRYAMLYKKLHLKTLLCQIGKFACLTAVAIAIAAAIFLPVMTLVLCSQRVDNSAYITLFYPKSYYLQFIPAFISGQSDYYCIMGYTAFGLFGVFMLFLERKKNTGLKIAFVMLTACLLVPYAGHVINGLAYVSNRYIWAYSMLVAYIFVKTYPSIKDLNQKKSKVLFLCMLGYGIACFANWRTQQEMAMTAFVCFFLLAVWIFHFGLQWVRENKVLWFRVAMAAELVACIGIQARYEYSADEHHYPTQFLDFGQALKELTTDAPEYILKGIKDNSIWRFDRYYSNSGDGTIIKNSALQLKENGVSYYWSLADGNINQFQREMYLNQDRDYNYKNLDDRTLLDTLSSVKYFIVHNKETQYLPYGYSLKPLVNEKFSTGTYSVYKSKDALPIAYTYSSYIPRKEYESLWVTQKQQALLQGCVLDSADNGVPQTELSFNDTEPSYTLDVGSGVRLEDGKIIVRKSNGEIRLHFTGIKNSETYLAVEGLDYRNLTLKEAYSAKQWNRLSVYEQNKIKEDYENQTPTIKVHMRISDGNVKKTLSYATKESNVYIGIQDYLINLGYNKGTPVKSITIRFGQKGVYSIGKLSVVCQPMSNINTEVSKLKQDALENVSLSDNRISGDIHLAQPKILCFSIPYSQGWTAYVDGKQTELKRANTMFMALDLPSGYHKVVLKYETPYLKKGLMISACGICILALICIIERKIGKKRNEQTV